MTCQVLKAWTRFIYHPKNSKVSESMIWAFGLEPPHKDVKRHSINAASGNTRGPPSRCNAPCCVVLAGGGLVPLSRSLSPTRPLTVSYSRCCRSNSWQVMKTQCSCPQHLHVGLLQTQFFGDLWVCSHLYHPPSCSHCHHEEHNFFFLLPFMFMRHHCELE